MHEPRSARPQAVAAVSAGLQVPGTQLLDAVEVEIGEELRNKRGWPDAIFAARIADLDTEGADIGAWVIGAEGAQPIYALDPIASQWASWAAGADRPESRAAKLVERISGYPEAHAAREAVKARGSRKRAPRKRR